MTFKGGFFRKPAKLLVILSKTDLRDTSLRKIGLENEMSPTYIYGLVNKFEELGLLRKRKIKQHILIDLTEDGLELAILFKKTMEDLEKCTSKKQ